MKYYHLLLFILITGCNHYPPDKHIRTYYGTPKLEGVISFNNQVVANIPIFLLTSCNDQQAITDNTGYFNFSNSCVESIPQVNSNELGFLYRVIVPFNNDNYTWTMSGLGYGLKEVSVLINLTTKTVVYRASDGVNPIFEKVTELTPLIAD